MINYSLEGYIKTGYGGYNKLCSFYHFCLGHPNGTHFSLDFTRVEWIDGNLCALLLAIVYHLNKTYGHTITTDMDVIKERFSVLLRNGFLKSEDYPHDDRQSTVPVEYFSPEDKEGFNNYLQYSLLTHRGMPSNLTDTLKEQIKEDILEVFCNTNHHANTQEPFFVGGQFYPKIGILKFTMVDLGDGFLPRIQKATQGKITDCLSSILWALEGNSSKNFLDNCPGGLGITSMKKYFAENNGVLQIISGDGFWSSDLSGSVFEGGRTLKNPFLGTTINLFFGQ